MVVSLRAQTFWIVAILAGGLLLNACAEDDGNGSLGIDGVDISYEPDTYEAEAGLVRIEFRNRGSLAHNIVFREAEGAPTAAAENEFLPAGATESYEVELVAGKFGFYCSVPGHEAAGMVGSLVVG